MHHTTRPVLAAAAICAALLAGCSAEPSSPPPPPAAPAPVAPESAPAPASSDAAVKWTNAFCAGFLQLSQDARTPPQIDQTSPQASLKGISAFLGRLAAGFDTAINGLKTVGPSPVAGGDEIVTRTTASMTGYRDAFKQAKADLEKADPNNQAALAAAVKPVTDLKSAPNPTADLQSNPELKAAAQQAPNCQALNPPAGAPAPPPPSN